GWRACRLLGGVSRARHQRPHRGPWPADGKPEQRRASLTGATMRSIARKIVSALLILLPLTSVQAQDFPTKPVRIVVPYAGGGGGDLRARLLGEKLSRLWGQQVIVDNKPGAGGLIATEFAARSAPDGYTLYLITDGPFTIAPTLHRKPLP